MTKDGEVLIEPHFENNEGSQEDIKQLNDEQYILLGVSFEEHPIKKIKQNYHGEYEIIDLSVAENDINNVSHCLVSLKSFRVIKTKTNKTMCFIKVEDDTKACDVTVFPTIYDKAKDILKDDNLFIITVKATERGLQAFSIKEYHEK
jgi:DNA polymerase III alpha subunit